MCGGGSNEIKETSAERADAEVRLQQWNRSNEFYLPLQEAYREDVEGMNTQGQKDYVTGAASSATNEQYSMAKSQAGDQLAASGLNPNSGRFKGGLSSLTTSQSVAGGDNVSRSNISLGDAYLQGKKNLLAIGNKQEANATAGLSSLANYSANQARRSAYDDFARDNARRSTLGSAVGLGAYGMQQYKQGGVAGSDGLIQDDMPHDGF